MGMAQGLVDIIELGSGVVALVLDRAAKRNALSVATWAALATELDEAAKRPDCRVIMLAARGPVFSAGGDNREVRSIAIGAPGSPEQLQLQCQERMALIKQPIVACVSGDVIGGAVGLVAAADIVVAAENAHFVLPEARLGLAPTLAASPLVARIGRAAAARLMLLGERVSARDCREMGLVTICASSDEWAVALERVLAALLSASPTGLAACKALVNSLTATAHMPRAEDLFRLTANLVVSSEARAASEAVARTATPPWAVEPPSAKQITAALADTSSV